MEFGAPRPDNAAYAQYPPRRPSACTRSARLTRVRLRQAHALGRHPQAPGRRVLFAGAVKEESPRSSSSLSAPGSISPVDRLHRATARGCPSWLWLRPPAARTCIVAAATASSAAASSFTCSLLLRCARCPRSRAATVATRSARSTARLRPSRHRRASSAKARPAPPVRGCQLVNVCALGRLRVSGKTVRLKRCTKNARSKEETNVVPRSSSTSPKLDGARPSATTTSHSS